MLDFERKLNNIESRLMNIIRVGTVTSLKPAEHRARVVFNDRDNMESYDLLVLAKNTGKNKDYAMPDIDEQVVCLFLPIGLEAGFVIGSCYTNSNARPASTENKRLTQYEDGTVIEYDRAAHELKVTIPEEGRVHITVNGPAIIQAPMIDLGESALEPVVLGDKLAAWITNQLKPWLDEHVHPETQGPYTGPAKDGTTGEFDEGEGATGGNVYSTKNRSQ